MSIEEKAKEYRSNTFGTPFGNDIEMAFSEGAEWMLEKALCWLKDHADNYAITNENGWGLVYSTIASDMFTEFRKAMEE